MRRSEREGEHININEYQKVKSEQELCQIIETISPHEDALLMRLAAPEKN